MSFENNLFALIGAAVFFKKRANGDPVVFGREIKEAGFESPTDFLLITLAFPENMKDQIKAVGGTGCQNPEMLYVDTVAVIITHAERFEKFVAHASEGKIKDTPSDHPLRTVHHYLFNRDGERNEARYYAMQAHSLGVAFSAAVAAVGEDNIGKIVEFFPKLADNIWVFNLRTMLGIMAHNYMVQKMLKPSDQKPDDDDDRVIITPQYREVVVQAAKAYKQRFIDYFQAMDDLAAKTK